MRPDQRWFPTSMPKRAAWFKNFATQFAIVGPSLGFTQEQIDSVLADNEFIQFLVTGMTALKAYTRSFERFQQHVLLGKYDRRTSSLSEMPVLNIPPIPQNGVFERLEKLVRTIRVSWAYTPAIGGMLGIIPKKSEPVDLAEHVPGFKAKPLPSGYSFQVNCTRRNFEQFRVEIRRASGDWESGGQFTFSREGVRIAISPTEPGKPEMIYVRVRMILDNKPVGNYSGIQTLVLSP